MSNPTVGQFRAIWQGILDRLSGQAGKAQVQDADVKDAIDALRQVDFSTEAGQDAVKAVLDLVKLNTDSIKDKDFSTSAKQDLIVDVLDALKIDTTAIKGKDFATDATLAQVKSELEAVKAELQAVKANQLSGDQKVQLSGTNVPQETTILTRAIRRATTGMVQINPPEGLHVRGVAIVCRIYGVTGTFGETEGLSMETGTFAGAYPAYGGEFMGTGSEKVKTTGGVAHIWLPGGTTVGDSKPISNYVYRRSGSPFVRGYLALQISGTFTSEQGFDCEVKAIWLV